MKTNKLKLKIAIFFIYVTIIYKTIVNIYELS